MFCKKRLSKSSTLFNPYNGFIISSCGRPATCTLLSMSNLHKTKRRVLEIAKHTYNDMPYVQVIWCVETKTTSKAVWSTHIGVSTYFNGFKNKGHSSYMSRKPVRANILDLTTQKQESLTEAYYNSLQGVKGIGTVIYFNKHKGEGCIKDSGGLMFNIFACNFKGANSAHHQLVDNIEVKAGDKLSFTLGDYFTTKTCGAIQLKKLKA